MEKGWTTFNRPYHLMQRLYTNQTPIPTPLQCHRNADATLGRTRFEPAISRSTIGSGHPIEVSEHGPGHFVDLDLGGSGKVHLDGVGNEEPPGIELERFQSARRKTGNQGG